MESIPNYKIKNSMDELNQRDGKGLLSQFDNWKNRFFDDGICMDYFSKANLFILCCVASCFALIVYLAAFSCEVSWILESRGELPVPAYILCTFYFLLFIGSIILIHGLATGLSWGLLCWSGIVGVLAIPELCLVMYMTIQYWGLQSTHGLVELVGYLVRLVVTCLTLICVIPTALRWRHEQKILQQLQSLATRLQLSTPTQNYPNFQTKPSDSLYERTTNHQSRRSSGFDNPAFISQEHALQMMQYVCNPYGSQNEFNASIFGLHPSQYIGPPIIPQYNAKRTQSLLDLRFIAPSSLPSKPEPFFLQQNEKNLNKKFDPDAPLNNAILNNQLKSKEQLEEITIDPIYYSIDSIRGSKSKSLHRNCVSLENLNGITSIKNDLSPYGNNLIKNYHWPVVTYIPSTNIETQQHNLYYPHYQPSISRYSTYNGSHQNFFVNNSSNNSRMSLGSDDYRRYRDVAL